MNAIVNTKPHEFDSEITRWLDDIDTEKLNVKQIALVALTDDPKTPFLLGYYQCNAFHLMQCASAIQLAATQAMVDDTLMNGVEEDDSPELEAHDHDRWEVDDDPDYDL